MAPEQAANTDGARATPVDVYALGVIFYRLLTGNWLRSPEGTPAETLAVVLSPPPMVLSGSALALPRDLQSILRMALATDPARRYRHARELEADLDRFAAKLPVVARKQTVLYVTTTLLRRQARRSIIAACIVLAGLLVAGTIYFRHRRMTERNEANLRYAYTLTSFTLGELNNQLRAAAPEISGNPEAASGGFPGASDGAALRLPVTPAGELDLRYYQAQLADLRSATSEVNAQYRDALTAIQQALDLYSQLALEAPDDPQRLWDAAKARLSFARLLDRTGRTAGAGGEARKSLRQFDRLAVCPDFDPTPIAPLRCDALKLIAKDAHLAGKAAEAAKYARDMLIAAESMSFGLLVRPENEAAPRVALAAADLATYAITAGGDWLPEARREIDRATAICRAAREQDPANPAMNRGLAHCLHATVRLALQQKSSEDLQPFFQDASNLFIGEGLQGRLFSFSSIRSFSVTITGWTKAVMNHPDVETAKAALELADKVVSYVRENGGGTNDTAILRARLLLYQSKIACRLHNPDEAAQTASRAMKLLRSLQLSAPNHLSLALLTATALHHARTLAGSSGTEWSEEIYGAHLDLLLKQLSERSAELTPEQRIELSSLK